MPVVDFSQKSTTGLYSKNPLAATAAKGFIN
jgi:hypothetical protein